MLELINKDWIRGSINSIHKKAVLVPILKPTKDPKKVEYYRPISLSCLGKLVEQLIFRRLYWFMEKRNLLPQEQCSFAAWMY